MSPLGAHPAIGGTAPDFVLADPATVRFLEIARDFFDFDDAVTAPLHGFSGCEDYWARSSCRPFLRSIAVPALVINALNDLALCGCQPPAAAPGRQSATSPAPAYGPQRPSWNGSARKRAVRPTRAAVPATGPVAAPAATSPPTRT